MNCEYLAYKPKEVTPGIWLPEDGIDYHSKYTSVKKYNPDGLLFYEIKNGYEEKTVFMDLLPTAKLMHHMFSYLEKKIMFHYETGGILKKTTFISYSDNFEVEHTEKNFFYENDSTICLHFLYNKPSYYDKTTLIKDKKIVEYWNADKRPYLRYEYHYNNDKLMTLVEFELPSNRIKQFWEHKYDSNGNCIEMQRFNYKKEPEHCWLYFFDEYNNCIKEQMVFGSSKRLVEDINFIHEYDYDGNWNRKVIYKNGSIQYFVDNKTNLLIK